MWGQKQLLAACFCSLSTLIRIATPPSPPPTYFAGGEAIAEVGHLELIFTSCPYWSFLRKNHGLGWRQTQRECPGKRWAKSRQVWQKKLDRFRSGGKHSPVRTHALTRSGSWAGRNHKMLKKLWRSKGLLWWVLLSNVRTLSLPSLLWLGFGISACVESILKACSCVCDWSHKRRRDTKKSEFDNEKTKEDRFGR